MKPPLTTDKPFFRSIIFIGKPKNRFSTDITSCAKIGLRWVFGIFPLSLEKNYNCSWFVCLAVLHNVFIYSNSSLNRMAACGLPGTCEHVPGHPPVGSSRSEWWWRPGMLSGWLLPQLAAGRPHMLRLLTKSWQLSANRKAWRVFFFSRYVTVGDGGGMMAF